MAYNVNGSSIRGIRKNVDKIWSAVKQFSALSAKLLTRVRNPVLEKMENFLTAWIEDQNQKLVLLSSAIVHEKMLKLYKQS